MAPHVVPGLMPLLARVLLSGAGGASAWGAATSYTVEVAVVPEPLLSYGPRNTWRQVFNPTWVEPSPGTGQRSGLLVRSQNCTQVGDCGPTCSGTGQQASWLTWVELKGDMDAGSAPSVATPTVDALSAVFGPFDCEGDPQCPDSYGTEDPRLTYDRESQLYYLLYNAWSPRQLKLSLASTADPTVRGGWARHGELFPGSGLASYKSGSILLRPAPGPHFVIWGCDISLRITPSVGRSLLTWDYNKTKVLLSVRSSPFWDTGFVESAMPPLLLSSGDLLFFYDSTGPWNGTSGYQPGWAVLSGADPTRVLARAAVPPLPWLLPWEQGLRPWPCNTPFVTNLGGGHRIGGEAENRFRVYFGGADAVIGAADLQVSLPAAAPRSIALHV